MNDTTATTDASRIDGCLIACGVPQQVADLFDAGTIRWQTGWGDYQTHTCLHGALLRPCSTPGDEIMWSTLLSYRGLTTAWNDSQTSAEAVVARLRLQADPDEAEMVEVFGPNWRQARDVCRTWAGATGEQRQRLSDAWAAWDARAARAARAAWDAWAAWAARAAWDARDARAAWDAWDARAAWAAWDAFLCVIARPWLNEASDWNEAAYARLMKPWRSVFGEPDQPTAEVSA